jgi:TonB family protein
MKSVCIRLAVCAGAWVTLTGMGQALPNEPNVVKPDLRRSIFRSLPFWRYIQAAYPMKAAKAHQNGVVVLRCSAAEDGQLAGCGVVAEYPSGFGFGESALKLAPQYRLKPPASGGPTIGKTFSFSLNFDSWAWRSGAPPNLTPGDAAVLVTELHGARPPDRSIFPCQEKDAASRYCLWTRVKWRQRPDKAQTLRAIETNDLDAGLTVLSCKAAPDGALADCRLRGVATPKAEAAALELARDFRVEPKGTDGSDVANGRIVIELNWKLMRAIAGAQDLASLHQPAP